MTDTRNVHGTGLVLDGIGLLIRGPSGSGKSLLALDLVDTWETRGRTALLVSDDRVDIVVEAGRLQMRAPERIAGLIELRGRGLISRPFAPTASLHLVVDLVEGLERMPEESAFTTELFGIELARAPVPRAGTTDARHQRLLVGEALRALQPTATVARQKTT